MKVFLQLVFFILCAHSSHLQILNKQSQGATQLLSYSESEFRPAPLITTSTAAPEETTKKGGFFSGIAGFFKGTTTTEATTTTTTTSTTTSTTTKKPQVTSTQKTTVKDEFPPLPTQAGGPQTIPTFAPNVWNTRPGSRPTPFPITVPNAWGTRPTSTTTKPTTKASKKPQVPPPSRRPSQDPDSKVTDAELLTLSESLFSKDIHNAFKHVTVNYQGRTYSSAQSDEASQPLLKIDDQLNTMNTVEKMKLMFNNYEQDTSINEYVTPIERNEENDFIDAVMQTPVMRHAMNFLAQKGVVTADPATHKELLKTIWFGMYSRGDGKISSSGFEHVFLSEVRNGSVIGLHNYVYFAEQEKSRDLDYKGWMKKIDLGNKGQIAKVRFTMNGLDKPTNSLFIGTSPELELAIYTVCFELRADQECRLAYGGKDFNIVTHSFKYRGKKLIGSAYPEI